MNWITEKIAIGDWRDAVNADLLRQEGIHSVLSLIGKLVGRSAESIGVQRLEIFPLQDGPGDDMKRFRRAVDLLSRMVSEGAPVLVHCRAGRSRSAAIVSAHLMHSLHCTAEEALALVASKRDIGLNPEMAALLREYTVSAV